MLLLRVKLSDQRSEVLPDGRASQPGKELVHSQIASLDPDRRSGLAGSRPVKEDLGLEVGNMITRGQNGAGGFFNCRSVNRFSQTNA